MIYLGTEKKLYTLLCLALYAIVLACSAFFCLTLEVSSVSLSYFLILTLVFVQTFSAILAKQFTYRLQDGAHNLARVAKDKDEIDSLLTHIGHQRKTLDIYRHSNQKPVVLDKMMHDLKRPFAIISNLMSTVPSLHTQESLQKASGYAEGLIQDYLEGGQLQKQEISAKKLLKEAVLLAVSAENIPKEISITCKDSCRIFVDYQKFLRVLINVIQNALHACSEHDRIWIIASNKAPNFQIEIANSGPEIPKDCLQNIFNPTYTDKKNNLGLGLTICKDIISLHKGSISCVSKRGKTSFVLLIPHQ